MKLVTESISLEELKGMMASGFGNLVKAVVDVERELMVVDAELHADEEAFLLQNGSQQRSLWGINLYPEIIGEDWIEFDSMINVRPGESNMSRGVEREEVRNCIVAIVNKLVQK